MSRGTCSSSRRGVSFAVRSTASTSDSDSGPLDLFRFADAPSSRRCTPIASRSPSDETGHSPDRGQDSAWRVTVHVRLPEVAAWLTGGPTTDLRTADGAALPAPAGLALAPSASSSKETPE